MNQFISELSSNRTARLAAVAVLILLAVFLLVSTWDKAFGRDVSDPFNTITVEGTGSSAMVPDTARITFSVMESASEVAAAQEAATAKTDAALAALSEMGIEERDIKTLSYNVSPKYEYPQPCYGGICPPSSPRIVGYDVSQTVEVKVRETEKAGDVLAALGGLGVQNISGPEFVVDDETAVKSEARAEAVEEARAKAKELAKQLGVRLGKVVSFSEMAPGDPYYGYGKGGAMMDARLESAPSLPVGENETEITVMITYEIR
ncbi:MAG TPA: SIMPL domain-containing protein [Candidatus Paceibacterota bacterium]